MRRELLLFGHGKKWGFFAINKKMPPNLVLQNLNFQNKPNYT